MARLPDKHIQQNLDSIRNSKKEASAAKASIVRLSKAAHDLTDKLSNLVSTARTDINAAKSETEQVKKDARREYNSFKSTYRAATHARDGIEARYKKLVSLHLSSQELENEISKNATKSRNAATTVTELRDKARKNEKDISDVHERAEVVRQEIEDTYGIVIDTTLAGTLIERKIELNKVVRLWQGIYLGSVGLISMAIVVALTVNRPSSIWEAFTERLVFVTPLVLVAFIAYRQFSHERKLLEEYAFKAATAQTLRGYTLLLGEQFKTDRAQEEILQFTIGAMMNIYDRLPLEASKGSYQFSVGGKLAKFEAKIDEKFDEVNKQIEKNTKAIEDVTKE